QLHTCNGAEYSWGLGYIFETYPLSIHSPDSRHNPGYELLSVDATKSVIRIRSPRCYLSTPLKDLGCKSCMGLKTEVDVIRDWAHQPFGKKTPSRLSHKQLTEKLISISKQLKNEQLKKADYFKSLKRARKKISSFDKLIDVISNNDVPGLSRLLSTAKKEGWSVMKTFEMILLALGGKYHPRNYTDFDKDLAILMYELGGGAALHALNKAEIMLPSRFTIANLRRHHSLRITVGDVKLLDIMENIEILFRNIDAGEHARVGHTLCIDEIAADGRLSYLPETDEIGGLCEYAISELETFKMGSDLMSVKAMVKAIRANRVHVGKEFSVAAFARHAQTDYGAKPVLLMPTCKKGSWKSSAKILQKLVQAWKLSPFGEAMHGRLESISSDGDPTRRAALYLLCMHKKLGRDDPLYKFLSGLIGLNLYTRHGEAASARIGKLLRSKEGILVIGVVINKSLIAQWLEQLPGYDWSDASIHTLLNPKDPQDVPLAVKLVFLVAELRHLDSSEFTPSERKTHRALCLLGETFHALLEPFINPTLSLSEQIIHLVKLAHLTCALFLQNEGGFIPNQLYGDIQCMVKNAIFKVAHTKVLNPLLKVFLCLLGDNVLEVLFGRSRMIGGHSPNMAIDELRQRFASALRIDEIFRKYPHLERHAQRLKMARSRDVDHLTPDDWKTDTAGKSHGRGFMTFDRHGTDTCHGLYGIVIDFRFHFQRENFDLMRPKGGKYPGVSKEVDRSLVDSDTTCTSDLEGDSEGSEDAQDILMFDAQAALVAEKVARDSAASESDSPPSIWIKLDDEGRKVAHKKTVLREFMDPTLDDVSDEYLLKLQGLFATLVSFNTSNVALAVLQCTVIKTTRTHPSNYLDAAPVAEISLPESQYEVTGQILSLVPFFGSPECLSWAWTTDFVSFDSAKAKRTTPTDAPARMRHLSIAVNGRLVLPLSLKDFRQATLEEILQATSPGAVATDTPEGAETTWVFTNTQLDGMRSTLLDRVKDEQVRLKIPVFGAVKDGRYPYEAFISNDQNERNPVSHCLPSIKAPSLKDGRRKCHICLKDIAGPDRQNHMGEHILLSICGVQENKLTSPVAVSYPCGFCGGSMTNNSCTIGIQSGKASSSCLDAYPFMVSAASNSSTSKPCTNVPIRCVLCDDIHWKYNMEQHLKERHPQ
ncbi:hypothetical protein C8J57DRAFT_1076384, partial [Mycena rebaudengoi]